MRKDLAYSSRAGHSQTNGDGSPHCLGWLSINLHCNEQAAKSCPFLWAVQILMKFYKQGTLGTPCPYSQPELCGATLGWIVLKQRGDFKKVGTNLISPLKFRLALGKLHPHFKATSSISEVKICGLDAKVTNYQSACHISTIHRFWQGHTVFLKLVNQDLKIRKFYQVSGFF